MGRIAAMGEAQMSILADTIRDKNIAGPDAPEKKTLKVGFMPLTDCASVVMAAVKGFDEKHGIKIIPTRESSWASVRDKLLSGELDAAHALYGMVYGVQLGIGGPKRDMAILMSLNQNGQGITLSHQLREAGIVDGPTLATGWPISASTQCLMSGLLRCHHPRWSARCGLATWMDAVLESHGTTRPLSTTLDSRRRPLRKSGQTIRKRCSPRPIHG
jgi:hypothetical protein